MDVNSGVRGGGKDGVNPSLSTVSSDCIDEEYQISLP